MPAVITTDVTGIVTVMSSTRREVTSKQTNKSIYDFVLSSEFLEAMRVHISYEIK